MWFTETPWPPISILAAIACVLLAAWLINARRAYLMGMLVCGLLSIGVYLVESWVVTTSEQLEDNVYALTAAFQQKKPDETLAFFSESALTERLLVRWAMEAVDVEDDLRVTDVQVELLADETRAKVQFRANATVRVSMYSGHAPSRWRLTWQKENDAWKIIKVERLHVTQNTELPIQAPNQ